MGLAARVGFLGWRDFTQLGTTNSSETYFGAVLQVLVANACWLVGLWADDHRLTSSNRALFMEPATLWVFLAWLDVLVDQVDAFYQKHPFFVVDRDDLALNAFVFSTDYLNCVAVMNLHFSRRIFAFGNQGVSGIWHRLSIHKSELKL